MFRHVIVGAALVLFVGTASAQQSDRQSRIGLHVGTDVTGGIEGFGENRVGVQGIVPIAEKLALSAGISWFFPETQLDGSIPGGFQTTISRWQTWIGGRIIPIGEIWYLGTGISYLHASEVPLIERAGGLQHFVQTGMEFSAGPLRPFVEMQLHNVLNWGRLNLLGGFNLGRF